MIPSKETTRVSSRMSASRNPNIEYSYERHMECAMAINCEQIARYYTPPKTIIMNTIFISFGCGGISRAKLDGLCVVSTFGKE